MCKTSFVNLVKNIINDKFKVDIRISKNVITVLQRLVEAEMIELLFKANLLTLHSERAKLLGGDIIFISQIAKDMHYLKNNMHTLKLGEVGEV